MSKHTWQGCGEVADVLPMTICCCKREKGHPGNCLCPCGFSWRPIYTEKRLLTGWERSTFPIHFFEANRDVPMWAPYHIGNMRSTLAKRRAKEPRFCRFVTKDGEEVMSKAI